jgi:hypothetical protein
MIQSNVHTHFDVAADGRFLMSENLNQGAARQAQIRIVLNWAEELKRIAPVKK